MGNVMRRERERESERVSERRARAWRQQQSAVRTRFAIKPGCSRSVTMLSGFEERNCIACVAMHTTSSSGFTKYVTRPDTQPAYYIREREEV